MIRPSGPYARSTPASSNASRMPATQNASPPEGGSSPSMRLASASLRPVQTASRSAWRSCSSTAPPGKTYAPPRNTLSRCRRSMNTSTTDSSSARGAPSRTSITVAASRVATTSLIGSREVDHVAEPGSVGSADQRRLEAATEHAADERARRREQHDDAEDVGQEARREHQRTAEQDEEAVDQLRARQLTGLELRLEPTQDAEPLVLHEPRAEQAVDDEQRNRLDRTDRVRDLDDDEQLEDRHHQEQETEHEHQASVPAGLRRGSGAADYRSAVTEPTRGDADASWAGRLLPRSVMGITALILAASLGAAFSGAVLYAYYEFRLDRSDSKAEQFASTFKGELDKAVKTIQSERDDAKKSVREELKPLEQLAATGKTLERIHNDVSPSVFFVSTLAEDGSPSVGSAFVVFSDAEQSFLLTSYATVRAATQTPGPAIKVRQGNDELDAKLQSVDPEKDLALLAVSRGNVKRLPWADGNPVVGVGDRVFAVSGLGAGGGAVSQGLVGDVSASGIQHDTPIGPQLQGSPLVNSNGEVVGVASRAYAPLGFAPDAVWFAPLIKSACEKVLQCPS